MGNYTIKRIFVDNDNLADVIFLNMLDQIRISLTTIQTTKATLVGFDKNESKAIEKITLPITIDMVVQKFTMMVVNASSA